MSKIRIERKIKSRREETESKEGIEGWEKSIEGQKSKDRMNVKEKNLKSSTRRMSIVSKIDCIKIDCIKLWSHQASIVSNSDQILNVSNTYTREKPIKIRIKDEEWFNHRQMKVCPWTTPFRKRELAVVTGVVSQGLGKDFSPPSRGFSPSSRGFSPSSRGFSPSSRGFLGVREYGVM